MLIWIGEKLIPWDRTGTIWRTRHRNLRIRFASSAGASLSLPLGIDVKNSVREPSASGSRKAVISTERVKKANILWAHPALEKSKASSEAPGMPSLHPTPTLSASLQPAPPLNSIFGADDRSIVNFGDRLWLAVAGFSSGRQ